jgi:hypothetical protein
MAATTQPSKPEKPAGKAALLELYKKERPDEADPDDDALFGYAHDRYADADGKLAELGGANTRLAELVARDPRLGAVVSMLAGDKPKSLPYAVSRVYGKDFLELEGSDLDDFEKGHGEYLAEEENRKKTQQQALDNYVRGLDAYGTENRLDDAQLDELHKAIVELTGNILSGNIPADVIDLVYKGLNHDRDVREAADTGFNEGKNERIDARLRKTAEVSTPDLGAAGSGNASPGGALRKPRKKGSFFDGLQEIDT